MFKGMTDYGIAALTRLRAETAGKIEHFQKEAERARRQLVHIDAVLEMVAPDLVLDQIKAKAYPKRHQSRKNGASRVAVDVLRESGKALTVGEIADAVAHRQGLGDLDRIARNALIKKVENTVRRLRDKRGAVAVPQPTGPQAWRLVD